ncbi:hypothetical protein CLOM_g574 [Closterium sp. NIES-68]|nr:hypothetical protein CLOM_g574 [Closterium sp. NIES-68]GJP69137.1 hypothetical protein CLOP_g95 [Closterium sp. NIES-67]
MASIDEMDETMMLSRYLASHGGAWPIADFRTSSSVTRASQFPDDQRDSTRLQSRAGGAAAMWRKSASESSRSVGAANNAAVPSLKRDLFRSSSEAAQQFPSHVNFHVQGPPASDAESPFARVSPRRSSDIDFSRTRRVSGISLMLAAETG